MIRYSATCIQVFRQVKVLVKACLGDSWNPRSVFRVGAVYLGILILGCKPDSPGEPNIQGPGLEDFSLVEGDSAKSNSFECGEPLENSGGDGVISATIENTILGDRDLVCSLDGVQPFFAISCQANYKIGHDPWSSEVKVGCRNAGGGKKFVKVKIHVNDTNQMPVIAGFFEDEAAAETQQPASSEGDDDVIPIEINSQQVEIGNEIRPMNFDDEGDDLDRDGDAITYSCKIYGGIYSTAQNCNSSATPELDAKTGKLTWKPLAIHAESERQVYTITITGIDNQPEAGVGSKDIEIVVTGIPTPSASFLGNAEAGDGFVGSDDVNAESPLFSFQATDHVEDQVFFSSLLLETEPASICDDQLEYSDRELPAIKEIPAVDGGYFMCALLVNIGGKQAYIKSQVIFRDTLLPADPVVGVLPAFTNSSAYTVTWNPADSKNTHLVKACAGNDCSISCGDSVTGVSSATVSDLLDKASYYFCVQSVDQAGNKGSWVPSSASILLDLIPPSSPVIFGIERQISGGAVDFSLTNGSDDFYLATQFKACTDVLCSQNCLGLLQSNQGFGTVSGLHNGVEYWICAQGVDQAGNTSPWVLPSNTVTAFQSGDWNTTLASTGVVVVDEEIASDGDDSGEDLLRDSQGNFYAIGQTHNNGTEDGAVWKFSRQGTLDNNYGDSGMVRFHDLSGSGGFAENFLAGAMNSSEELFVTGVSDGFMFVLKLTSNGSLDANFANQGKYLSPLADSVGNDILIDDHGRIVVVGSATGTNKDLFVWRMDSSGVLDSTFDSDGLVSINGVAGGNGEDEGYAGFIDGNGKILVVGASDNGSNQDLIIAQFLANGTLDTTNFASPAGILSHDNAAGGAAGDDAGFAIVKDDNDSIFISGRSHNGSDYDMTVWKLSDDGALDSGFAGSGYISYDSAAGGQGDDLGRDLLVDNSGRILVVGESLGVNLNQDFVLYRYTSVGALDSNFSADGILIHDNAAGELSGEDSAKAILLEENHGLFILGDSYKDVGKGKNIAIWGVVN